jgi:hypothetical protein
MFYTYLWLREDGTPYYAGKGSKTRAYISWAHGVHKPAERSNILVYPAESESDAFETEVALIWYYGRKDLGTGCLRNRTDGGEGASGHRQTEEHKRKISAANLGKPKPPRTEEHKRKLREFLKAYVMPEAVRVKRLAALRAALVGKPKVVSEETRKKISTSLTGKPGHKSTEETNQKIRVKALERYANRRIGKE